MNKPSEFSDVLNWEQVLAPGVIGCKDGAFLAGWHLSGLDTESLEPEVLDAAMARLGRGFGGFREESAFWVIFNRRASGELTVDTTRTKPPALELLEEETRLILSADAALFRNDIHIVYQFKPADPFLTAEESLAMFAKQCRLVETRLGSVLDLTRLGRTSSSDLDHHRQHFDALAGLLAGLLSGRQRRLRVPEHSAGVYLDRVLGVDFVQSSLNNLCHIDGRPAAIISLDGFPIEFGRGTLQVLETLDFEYQWVTRYAPLSPRQARSEVHRLRRFWRQRGTDITAQLSEGGGGERDAHADLMAQEADEVFIDLGRGDTGYGHFASTLILFAAPGAAHSPQDSQSATDTTGFGTPGFEALAEQVETVTTCFLDAGFEARLERQGALEAYLGSLPGHAHRNPREVLMSSSNLVELIPLRTVWKGEAVNPSPLFPANSPALLLARAQTGELFHFNLHHGDVGHTLIFGPTGAGKSVLLGLMAAQFLKYNGAQVVFFDKRRSSQHATYALGGRFITFGGTGKTADGFSTGIAPMAHLSALGRDWGINWVHELARQADVELTPARRTEIRAAIENALKTGSSAKVGSSTKVGSAATTGATKAGSSATTGGKADDPASRMSLADLRGYVQDPELRAAIQAIEGDDGNGILNQDHGDLSWADLTVFETHDLFEQSEAVAVLALDYIFAELEQRFDGKPTLLILDEAWSFLRHPIFVERIRSWLKEARKSNVAVVLATQSISDVIGSDITPVLLESCKTKIFLPNPAAKTDEARNQYRALGVNETQIDLISAITPKQDYYLVKPDGQRVVDFLLGPVALSILGNTDTADSKRADELYAKNPDFWKDDVARVIAQTYLTPHTQEGTTP